MLWGGRSILFFLGMGRGKEKLKKSEMSLLSRDIVEKVGDKILHEIMEEDHKKLFVNEINAMKQSIFQKRPNYDVTIASHTSKNRFPNGIS